MAGDPDRSRSSTVSACDDAACRGGSSSAWQPAGRNPVITSGCCLRCLGAAEQAHRGDGEG